MTRPKPLIPRSKIRSALRRLWLYSAERKAAKQRARIAGTKMYMCADCHRPTLHPEIDHIVPCGSTDNLEEFARRLFCSAAGLRVLDAKCHEKRTKGKSK